MVFVWTAEQGKIWTENDFEDTVITTPSFSLESQSVFGDGTSNKIETGAGADFVSGGAVTIFCSLLGAMILFPVAPVMTVLMQVLAVIH